MASAPLEANLSYRTNATEGLEGVIEGWADPEMRTVLLTVNLKIEGKFQKITQGVNSQEPQVVQRVPQT